MQQPITGALPEHIERRGRAGDNAGREGQRAAEIFPGAVYPVPEVAVEAGDEPVRAAAARPRRRGTAIEPSAGGPPLPAATKVVEPERRVESADENIEEAGSGANR